MRPLVLALAWLVLISGATASAFEEKDGLVVMEAESTTSNPGRWRGKTAIEGFTGKGYIEFTGNATAGGAARSPLVYVFKVHKPGLYYLHLRTTREDHGQPNDHSNDCYVRVDGNYGPGPNPGDKHGDHAPLSVLKKDTKFFGGRVGTFSWTSGCHLDLGGHDNKRVAVYDFKAGQTYHLVVSGRSQHFALDRIVFRHADVPAKTAEDLELAETKAAE
ncbi:MAG: hypothetical protein WD042_09870 [Phycisphaeraceae bacterium]